MMEKPNISKKEYKKLEKVVLSRGFKNRLVGFSKFILPFKKKLEININLGGGSFTDWKSVTVGVPELFWDKPMSQIIMVSKALMAHEIEHNVSSNIDVFFDFQKEVEDFFQENYDFKGAGRLGAQMFNATEDGRIEKRLVSRLKGLKKYIQFMNGEFWKASPVKGEQELGEYTLNVCYMATSGVWMKDFDKVYKGTRMEDELKKVKSLIIEAINQPTAQGCANTTMEIIKTNADYIFELMSANKNDSDDSDDSGNSGESGGDPLDQLDRDQNEYSVKPAGPGMEGFGQEIEVELTESSHFVPEEENKKEEKESPSKGSGSDSFDDDEEDTENSADTSGSGEKDDANDSESNASDGSEDDSEDKKGEDGDESDSSKSTDSDKDDDEDGFTNIDDIIDNTVEEVKSELEEDNERAYQQTMKENDRLEKEEKRKGKEREASELSKDERSTVLNYHDGEICGIKVRYVDTPVEGKLDGELKRKGTKFRKDVEKIFLNKEGFTRKNKRQGLLDTNALWRMNSGDTDVFIKKGNPKESDFVISLLSDNSGSMSERLDDGNTKAHHAKNACVILEEGLKGIVPLRITQFDTDGGFNQNIRHNVIRDFGDKDMKNYSEGRIDNIGLGNGDGYSIKVAHRELMKRPERQKVLFILSDGLPAEYRSQRAALKHVREAVEDARKDGVIVIAIRFGRERFLEQTASSYKEMYQHSYISCAPQDIQKELVKVLKKVIK